jgi:hypothetical protein
MATRPHRSADGRQRGGDAAGACIPLSSAIKRAHNITARRMPCRACVFDACLISNCGKKKRTLASGRLLSKAADVEKRSSPGGGGMPGLSACVRRLRRAARFPSRLCRYAHCRGSLVNFAHVRAPLVAVVVRMCPADGGGQLHTGAWPVPGRPVCLSCPHLQDGTGPGLRAPWPRSGAGLTTALWQACSRPAHASRA